MNKSLLRLVLLLAALGLCSISPPAAASPTIPNPQSQIADRLLAATENGGRTDFLVVLAEQADLHPAYRLPSKQARGRWVFEALRETAERSQADLRAWLDARGVAYRPYYIVNAIYVQAGDRALLETLAARADVTRLEANPPIHLALPDEAGSGWQPALHSPAAIQWNIQMIRAPEVWAMGYTGQGIVIGGQDTGYDWDHPAIIGQYRGWDGAAAHHDYNWLDAVEGSPAPIDPYGHGTHTMGIAVGDGGIGAAPGARWIGCRNMDSSGYGTPARYLACFEFFLAPYPVGGTPAQGNPDLAPDVTNNSWTCPPNEGCSWGTLQAAVEAQRAAGIMTVVSAGNSGSACSTVNEPPALYDAAYSVGATTAADAIASFSSRGPVTVDGSLRLKPDIAAPGESVYSCTPGGYYGSMSGTSMAAPHVAGAVALLWSARPGLRGQVARTEEILNGAAVPRYSTQCGDAANAIPNNVYGWGRLDALAAVRRVSSFLDGAVVGVTGGAPTTPLPLEGVAVRARMDGEVYAAVTGASGYYTMAVTPGIYTVEAWKYGYNFEARPGVVVAEDSVTTFPFTLTQAARRTLSGCVTDAPTGAPLSATITLAGPLGDWMTRTLAPLPSGCYSLTLAAGPYTVTAEAAFHAPATAFVNLDSDATRDFALAPTVAWGALWGRVTDLTSGEPLTGAVVQASPGPTATLTGESGGYEMRLPAGRYTVTVSAPFHAPAVETGVEIARGVFLERNYALPSPRLVLSPTAGLSVTLRAGERVTRALHVGNAGSAPLSFTATVPADAPWLALAPAGGQVAPGAMETVAVTFDAAQLTRPGLYRALLRFHTDDPTAQPYATCAVTMTARYTYSVALAPSAAARSGRPGASVTYTLRLSNTGEVTDTFGLSLSGHVWTTTVRSIVGTAVISAVGPLGAGESVTLVVWVEIPAGASPGEADTVTLTATSAGDGARFASATLTTTAWIPPPYSLYLPVAMMNHPSDLTGGQKEDRIGVWSKIGPPNPR